MHLSKKTLYLGIIAYSVTLLLMQDWHMMASTQHGVSAAWLAKMGVDVLFALMGFIRLAGPALFADDEGDDEMSIHEEDLHFSDSFLFGGFMLNVLGNLAWHGYITIESTGASSYYFSLWCIAEAVVAALAYILWSHAAKVQRRMAKKSQATGGFAGSTKF